MRKLFDRFKAMTLLGRGDSETTIHGELVSRGPHVIYVPNDEEWVKEMPEWAHGRRLEILENVQHALGTKNYEYDFS